MARERAASLDVAKPLSQAVGSYVGANSTLDHVVADLAAVVERIVDLGTAPRSVLEQIRAEAVVLLEGIDPLVPVVLAGPFVVGGRGRSALQTAA